MKTVRLFYLFSSPLLILNSLSHDMNDNDNNDDDDDGDKEVNQFYEIVQINLDK